MDIDGNLAARKIGDMLAILRGDPLPQDQVASPTNPNPKQSAQSNQRAYSGGYRGTGQSSSDQDDFYRAVLQGLGMPTSDANLSFMRAWNQAEGMDSSHYNPFATTQWAPDATSINSVGVKSYPDFNTGVQATVQTLTNGYYQNILDALTAGTDPLAAASAVANSPWGTGSLVERVLGG